MPGENVSKLMQSQVDMQAAVVGTLRILIVEDDAMICDLLAELLASLGHVVCGIETTEAGAVEAAGRERPDLIIADVTLKAGSGVRAIEQILRTGPVAHVFMSGNRLPRGYEALLKPFRPAELVEAMSRAVRVAGPAA